MEAKFFGGGYVKTEEPCYTMSNPNSINRMTIDVGFALLTAIVYNNDNGAPVPEISIYLEDKETGMVTQDIALVLQAYNESNGEVIPEMIDCIVWAESDNEDYTNKFQINHYVEEKEDNG